MQADIYLDRTEGGSIEISVIKHGLASGAGHKYETAEKARVVLQALGLDMDLIDRQLRNLAKMPPSFLVRLPTIEIPEEVLRSLGFIAAAFQSA